MHYYFSLVFNTPEKYFYCVSPYTFLRLNRESKIERRTQKHTRFDALQSTSRAKDGIPHRKMKWREKNILPFGPIFFLVSRCAFCDRPRCSTVNWIIMLHRVEHIDLINTISFPIIIIISGECGCGAAVQFQGSEGEYEFRDRELT